MPLGRLVEQWTSSGTLVHSRRTSPKEVRDDLELW